MKSRFKTCAFRVAAALAVGPLLAILVALSQSWAAFPALGFTEGRDVFLGHLLTKAIDYGPGYFLALLLWVACARLGARLASAIMVGVLGFYVAPPVYALIYLAHDSYWVWDCLPTLFLPRVGALVIGAVLAIVMWVIAYWRPTSTARIVAGS